jgi:hypothetical protein
MPGDLRNADLAGVHVFALDAHGSKSSMVVSKFNLIPVV